MFVVNDPRVTCISGEKYCENEGKSLVEDYYARNNKETKAEQAQESKPVQDTVEH